MNRNEFWWMLHDNLVDAAAILVGASGLAMLLLPAALGFGIWFKVALLLCLTGAACYVTADLIARFKL